LLTVRFNIIVVIVINCVVLLIINVVLGSDAVSNGQKDASVIPIESRRQVTIDKNTPGSKEIKNCSLSVKITFVVITKRSV